MTVSYFKQQGIRDTVIYLAINKFEERGTFEFAKSPGRPRNTLTEKTIENIDRALERDPGLSVRGLAKISKISPTSAHRGYKELGWGDRLCQYAPKLVNDQAERIQSGAARIFEQLPAKVLIIDDESYFPANPRLVPGKKHYKIKPGFKVPIDNMTQPKERYFKKFLVWQAIDSLGNFSEPYISEGTMNAEEYLICLKNFLLPFILKHHNLNDVLFWPDLARIHYAKVVIEWLNQQKIDFVSKERNTPHFPAGRPIERLWSLIKARYKKRKRVAREVIDFERDYRIDLQRVERRSGKALVANLAEKLRITAEFGPDALTRREILGNSNKNNVL